MNILSDRFWPLVTSVSFICCTKQLSLVLGMFCLAQVRNSLASKCNAWPAIQQVRQGNLLFLSDSGCHKVCSLCQQTWKASSRKLRWVSPFPPLFLFSAVKCISLHHRNGSVSAETFLPFCCCVIECLCRNILDCSYFLYFCITSFFPNCGRF